MIAPRIRPCHASPLPKMHLSCLVVGLDNNSAGAAFVGKVIRGWLPLAPGGE